MWLYFLYTYTYTSTYIQTHVDIYLEIQTKTDILSKNISTKRSKRNRLKLVKIKKKREFIGQKKKETNE